MRLLRLRLENWRGVSCREITFSDTVTIIEGPNEIGKSTIIEALQTLFRELDSSGKKQIKAIMPVGEDVGSRVEAEVVCGDYHFVYAKRYNRDRQTTLDILAPEKRQLSGREAHETVERILEETVDLALWEALLIDQGERIGLTDLKESTGLARALDEAAGSADRDAGAGGEDSSLFASVQREYESYFTPSKGDPRYSAFEQARDDAAAVLENASRALAEVDANSVEQQRRAAEVARLESALPELQQTVTDNERRWQDTRTLTQQLTALEAQLESAQTLQSNLDGELAERQQLIGEIDAGAKQYADAQRELQPLGAQAENLRQAYESAATAITEGRRALGDAEAALELAEADQAQLSRLEQAAKIQTRLQQLEAVNGELKQQLAILTEINVDDAAIERFRSAESDLAVARSQRDAAATTVSVSARAPLSIRIDDDTIELDEEEQTTRALTARTTLHIASLADITVMPPLSASELAEQTARAERSMRALISEFGVATLAEAYAANQRRLSAAGEVRALKKREAELLGGANIEELRQALASLDSECTRYQTGRAPSPPLPADLPVASDQVTEARARVSAARRALTHAEEQTEAARSEHDATNERLRDAQQTLTALEAALQDRRQRLATSRSKTTDEDLHSRVASARGNLTGLEARLDDLQRQLAEENAEAAEARLENARAVLARASAELSAARTGLAVLDDRLEQAQANGRFEEFENAERDFEAAEQEYQAVHRRAQAARLLWTTLNRHRDAAREAYVRPLKNAIERLGAIVFGGDFEVSIDDDWSIVSRTLHGRTLPYEELSVGAREQLAILARLAAAQIVSSQGGVPLFIDDALGFSDPGRLATMGAAIAAAGRDAQIIILTCTPGRFMHVGNASVVKLTPEQQAPAE